MPKPWHFDWFDADPEAFTDLLQLAENLIPFCQAVNERLWACGTSGTAFPESVEQLLTNPAYLQTVNVQPQRQMQLLDPLTGLLVDAGPSVPVPYSPQYLVWALCGVVYTELIDKFLDPDFTAADALTYPDASNNTFQSFRHTHSSGGVLQFPHPGGGPERRYPREIFQLSAPGSAGQIARYVWRTFSPVNEKPLSWQLFEHDGTAWGPVTTPGVTEPDILVAYGVRQVGDILGPWLLNDVRDTIDELVKTIAVAVDIPPPPPITGAVNVALPVWGGSDWSQAHGEAVGLPDDPATYAAAEAAFAVIAPGASPSNFFSAVAEASYNTITSTAALARSHHATLWIEHPSEVELYGISREVAFYAGAQGTPGFAFSDRGYNVPSDFAVSGQMGKIATGTGSDALLEVALTDPDIADPPLPWPTEAEIAADPFGAFDSTSLVGLHAVCRWDIGGGFRWQKSTP